MRALFACFDLVLLQFKLVSFSYLFVLFLEGIYFTYMCAMKR